ncbi:MAG: glutaredoxin family protein [Solirubrobacteraceae bacterium]
MPSVILYGREGCCLCEDALAVLERVARRIPFELQTLDIESDDALLAAYMERIPVILIDGREAFELLVGEAELERALSHRRIPAAPSVE